MSQSSKGTSSKCLLEPDCHVARRRESGPKCLAALRLDSQLLRARTVGSVKLLSSTSFSNNRRIDTALKRRRGDVWRTGPEIVANVASAVAKLTSAKQAM